MKRVRPLIILIALAAVAYFSWRRHQATAFRYAGTLEADEVDISPGVTSQIRSYEVKEGDQVKAGQLLVRLACEEVRINAAQVETDFARAERLLKAGSMTRAEYDRLKYRHDQALLQVGWCDIKAPSDGTVLSIIHRAGEWVRPGMNLCTMADIRHLYTFIYVPKPVLPQLRPGLAVEGSLPELKDRTFQGKVAYIRPEAEFTPKNVQTRDQRDRLVFGVKVAFENADGTLNPGLPIEVKLPVK
jgi:HlyD family secretion protein